MTLHTVCLCVAAVLGSAAAFAGGFQLNELGSRAMAQGGAFAARASDPSAIYFNPAGLAFQPQAELYLGTTFILPQVSFYGPVADANDPAIKNETKMTSQTFTPISLYGIYPAASDVTVGIGVTNPYGFGDRMAFQLGRKIYHDAQTPRFCSNCRCYRAPHVFRSLRSDEEDARSARQVAEAAATFAKERSFDPNLFLDLRLAPDQFALARQIQVACDTAKLAASRLSGKEAPSTDTEKTLDELHARARG